MRFTKGKGRLFTTGAAVASLALAATACGGGGELETGPGEKEAEKEITIGLIPWEDGIAATALWQVVLEEKGYEVNVENVDVAPLFEGLSQGDVDLFLDAWLPDTHADYWEKYGDQVEDVGAWYDKATLELTVPSYVEDVDSIEDLKGNEEMFGEEIVGIESGSGLVRTTKEEAIPTYGLDDYTLVESSTAAMLTELDAAIAKEEPVLVTLWRPHIAYADYDLKDLKDPEGAMGEGEEIHSVGRDGFSEDYSDLNSWLQEFKLDDTQLMELEELTINEYADEPEKGAREWLKENPEYLTEVMGEDAEDIEL